MCIFLDVSTTPSGKSALHLAAWKGPLSHVNALLDRGVPIDMHSTSPGNLSFYRPIKPHSIVSNKINPVQEMYSASCVFYEFGGVCHYANITVWQ